MYMMHTARAKCPVYSKLVASRLCYSNVQIRKWNAVGRRKRSHPEMGIKSVARDECPTVLLMPRMW